MKKRSSLWLGVMAVVALAAAVAALVGAYGRLYALPPSNVPSILDYQGRLTDAGGTPLTGSHMVTFRLYDSDQGGNLLWSESQNVTVQPDGVFDVFLGTTSTLSSAIFATPPYLELMVQEETLTPRQRLASVPYAFVADDALKLGGNSASDYTLRTDLSVPGTINDAANLVDWSRLKNVPAEFADGLDDAGGLALGDADTLDSLDSIQFLRSDTGDTFTTGTLTMASGTTLDVDGTLRMDGTVVKSNTNVVTNLNADLLDGLNSTQFLRSDVDSTLAAVRTVGNLNADLLDGLNSTDFIRTTDWNGNINGDLNVSGTLTTTKLSYLTPRVHRVSIPGEGFHPRAIQPNSGLSYTLGGGDGGAAVTSINVPLTAAVSLPDGARITEFKAFFYDVSATSNVEVTFQRLHLGNGGYQWLATPESSGSGGYTSATASIANHTVDNANYGYSVEVIGTPWDGINLKLMGVVITYTVSEAP